MPCPLEEHSTAAERHTTLTTAAPIPRQEHPIFNMVALTQEEMDAIIYDAREGDLEYLTEVFTKIIPGSVLPSIQDENTLSTPVHMAAANGHVAVVQFLLGLVLHDEAVKLVARKNDTGNTPLHWAAYSGHLEVVQVLVEKYGADVYDKNLAGHDALFEAETNGQEAVENWLLLKFALEDTISVRDEGPDTKITYTPGSESHTIDHEAAQAKKELADVRGGAAEKAAVADVCDKTEALEI